MEPMRSTRIAIALDQDDMAWLKSVQDEIRVLTGEKPPGPATLLRSFIRAIRMDDEAANTVGITVANCH